MAKAYDIFNYDSALYGVMRDPTRRATQACQNANRALDTLKERVLIEFGLPNTSEYIHNLAHWFPPFFDRIGDILHQRHHRSIQKHRNIRNSQQTWTEFSER